MRRLALAALAAICTTALLAMPATANHPPIITGGHGHQVTRFPSTGAAYVEVAIDTQFGYTTSGDPYSNAVRCSTRITKVVGISRAQIDQCRVGSEPYGVALDDVNIPNQHAATPRVPVNSGAAATIRGQSDFVSDLDPTTAGAQFCDPAGQNVTVASRVYLTVRRAADGVLLTGSKRSNYTDAALAPCTPPPPPGPSADLEVTVSDSPDPVGNGEQVTYTVTAVNNGPDIANGASVLLNPSDSLTVTSVAVVGGAACTLRASTADPNDYDCPLGALSDDETATILVRADATVAGPVVLTAFLDSSSGYADTDSDTESTTVQPVADLALTKTATPVGATTDPADFTYSFAVHNTGPDNATGVTVTDPWPAGLSDPTGLPANCDYDPATDTLSCDFGAVADAATETVTFTATAPEGSTTNTATVDGDQTDPDLTDNSDSATATVVLPT